VSRDISKSVGFYKLLGVDVVEAGGEDHCEGTTPSGVRIMLDSVTLVKSLNPKWIAPAGSAIVLCFKQESPAKVDEMHAKIVAAGFASVKEPWDAFWGQRYASVSDPDGNQIDLFAAL
jgi:uncharacterized glyoxalase superfamily protein PhnB